MLIFYQNSWTHLIFNGFTLRQFNLLRWVIFFGLFFELFRVWRRLRFFVYLWLPALSFFYFRAVTAITTLKLTPLNKTLIPLTTLIVPPSARIFNWTRRYLIFLTWFFYLVYLTPINRNSRIITLPLTMSLRTVVWTFLWY